jgi:hypothetical protein
VRIVFHSDSTRVRNLIFHTVPVREWQSKISPNRTAWRDICWSCSLLQYFTHDGEIDLSFHVLVVSWENFTFFFIKGSLWLLLVYWYQYHAKMPVILCLMFLESVQTSLKISVIITGTGYQHRSGTEPYKPLLVKLKAAPVPLPIRVVFHDPVS